MVDISKIMSYLAAINTDGDEKITQDEIDKAGDKVPSVFLSRLSTMVNGKDIPVEQVLKGWGVESNPENKPVTGYNDKRPSEQQDLSGCFVRLDKVPTKEEYRKDFEAKGIYDVALPLDRPLNSDLDFSNSLWLLQESSFNETTFANTPNEHLPEGYDPKKVIELGKDPGLNARKVHEKGITGKGVNIALMDWALLNSDNYDENIVSYSSAPYASKVNDSMHGCAVASILAGKETGVAPDANVYYFAEYQGSAGNDQDMVLSFKRMLEINKNLPVDEKIRVVSISGTPYGGEEMNKLLEQAKKDGIWVMSSPEFWENFGYLGRVDPMSNPDDFDNYKIQNSATKGRQLYVNSGNRTVTNHTVDGEYRHDSKASASWAIPVVAGYYALACQVDPSITPERFLELADETAQIKEVDVPFDVEKAKQERYYSEGFGHCFQELIKKEKPEIAGVSFDSLDDQTAMNYIFQIEDQLKASGIEYPNEYFIALGKEIYQTNGWDIDNEIRYPENTKTNIKIVDIDALINKLQKDKNKKAE